jgi:tetratricopeptide (TPR) repeat protein
LHGRTLYLAQATSLRSWDKSNPHFEAIKEFATVLETRNKSGLRWKYEYYPDDDHSSVAFIGEYDGLRFIFEKYRADFNKISTAEQLKFQYQQLSKDLGVTFLPPERITQFLGNTYLSLEKYDTALGFFQMNTENYQNSSSALATMGQYWKAKGDKRKALEYYEKSVKVFPENNDSLNNIEKLKNELKSSRP